MNVDKKIKDDTLYQLLMFAEPAFRVLNDMRLTDLMKANINEPFLENFAMAITEAKEYLGIEEICEDGSCKWS